METKYTIWFDTANIYLKSNQGNLAYLPLEDYKPLLNASNEERNQYEFSPFGIHWRKLDEDLCFDGFIPMKDKEYNALLITSVDEYKKNYIS